MAHGGKNEPGTPSGSPTHNKTGPIRCHCGALLADWIDGKTVVIDGVEYQFRRKGDRLTCPRCRVEHPRRSLRPSELPEAEASGDRRRHDDLTD
jgi:hypothetical protein